MEIFCPPPFSYLYSPSGDLNEGMADVSGVCWPICVWLVNIVAIAKSVMGTPEAERIFCPAVLAVLIVLFPGSVSEQNHLCPTTARWKTATSRLIAASSPPSLTSMLCFSTPETWTDGSYRWEGTPALAVTVMRIIRSGSQPREKNS